MSAWPAAAPIAEGGGVAARGDVYGQAVRCLDIAEQALREAMDWIFDFVTPDAAWLSEIAAATGAMLVGRRTDEVGDRMDASQERGSASSDEGYPFSGPSFVLTHEPPDPPARRSLTSPVTSGKRSPGTNAAGGRTSKSSVLTWPVSACSGVSWTRSWCMSCRCCSATASGSDSSPGLARIDLEPLDSTRHGAVTILRFGVRKQPSVQ